MRFLSDDNFFDSDLIVNKRRQRYSLFKVKSKPLHFSMISDTI